MIAVEFEMHFKMQKKIFIMHSRKFKKYIFNSAGCLHLSLKQREANAFKKVKNFGLHFLVKSKFLYSS